MSENIIEVKNLTKKFALASGFFDRQNQFVYAVNDVSFSIERGKTYGLVGESGCGKSTTAKLLVGMYRPDGGEITFYPKSETAPDGKSAPGDVADGITFKAGDKKSKIDSHSIKYVFQDPGRSLNPRMTVYSILTDGLKHSKKWPGKERARKMAAEILEEVGLDPSDLDRRPSEFSGGQRQRISIARGLLMEPQLLICDEVVSALDVSIQGQILNLLQEIRNKRNLSYLFIAHDLRVSCYFCDKIGVMYRGVLVEEGAGEDLYKTAVHPYTKLLFEGAMNQAQSNSGEVKSALTTLTGCPFAHRCPKATERCKTELPDWEEVGAGHKVRCFCK